MDNAYIIPIMKNKISDHVALQNVVNQYINKRAQHNDNLVIKRSKTHKFSNKKSNSLEKNPIVTQLHIQIPHVQQQTKGNTSISHHLNSLIAIKPSIPFSSRLFSHDDEQLSPRSTPKQPNYEYQQPQMQQFYGRANLRIRQLKKQSKRKHLAQNHNFKLLFNRTLETITPNKQLPFAKTYRSNLARQRSNSVRKIRLNNTVVLLDRSIQKQHMSKTGLQFYRTLYKQ